MGYAAERSMDAVLRREPPPAWRPSLALPGDSLREAYRVRMNEQPMDLARFSSRHKPAEVAQASGKDLALLHGDGSGGTVYWLSDAFQFEGTLPCGDAPGSDPGGVRPPDSRRLLSAASDRADRLSSALYACSSGSLRLLSEHLMEQGWESSDLRLWIRGGETLLVEAGPPGAALVYWRASGEAR